MPEVVLYPHDPKAVAALAGGMQAGHDERHLHARHRPTVYARLLWWEDGAHGHYPDCPCGACAWHKPPENDEPTNPL